MHHSGKMLNNEDISIFIIDRIIKCNNRKYKNNNKDTLLERLPTYTKNDIFNLRSELKKMI